MRHLNAGELRNVALDSTARATRTRYPARQHVCNLHAGLCCCLNRYAGGSRRHGASAFQYGQSAHAREPTFRSSIDYGSAAGCAPGQAMGQHVMHCSVWSVIFYCHLQSQYAAERPATRGQTAIQCPLFYQPQSRCLRAGQSPDQKGLATLTKRWMGWPASDARPPGCSSRSGAGSAPRSTRCAAGWL